MVKNSPNARIRARQSLEAKRLAQKLDSRYAQSPTVQSAVTAGRNQVSINGTLYPAEGIDGQGAAVAVVNVGTPAVAKYAPSNLRSVVSVGGGIRSGGGGGGGGGGTTYTAGDGIAIDGSNVISAKRDAAGAVGIGGTGGLLVNTGNGIQISSNALAVKLATNPGLLVDSNGLTVKINATAPGLLIDTNGLAVKLHATASGLALSSNGLAVDLATDPGLEISSGDLRVKAYHGINRDSNGIGVKLLSGMTALAVDANGLAIADAIAGTGLGINPTTKVLSVNTATGLTTSGDNVIVNQAFDFAWTGTHSFAAAVTFNDPVVMNDNGTFNTGVFTFNTDPQLAANLDFIGATPRSITAASHLTISPTGDLTLDPTGLIVLPDAQEMRTANFSDLVTGITGFRLWDRGSNYRQITTGALKIDELYARVFVADEVRIDRGEEYWSKSYGVVEEDFTTPADEATVDVWFENAAALSDANLFSVGDWLLARTIDWGSGLVIQKIWWQVVSLQTAGSVDGLRQRWRIRRKSGGTTGFVIKKGNTFLDAGQIGQGWIHLSALAQDGGPFVQIGDYTSVSSDTPQFTNRVRMGNLNGVVDYSSNTWGFAAGDDLGTTPSAGFSGITAEATNGVRLFNTDIALYQSGVPALTITRDNGIKILQDDSQFLNDNRYISWHDDLASLGTAIAYVGSYGSASARNFDVSVAATGAGNESVLLLQALQSSPFNATSITLASGDTFGVTGGQITLDAAESLVAGRLSIGTSISPDSIAHIHESTTATGTAAGVTIEQAGSGDAVAQFLLTGGARFVMGIDNSDSDKFKIAKDADLGSTPALVIDYATRYIGLMGVTDPSSPLTIATPDSTLANNVNQITLRSQRTTINSAGLGLIGGIGFRSNDTQLTAPGNLVAAIQAVATTTHNTTDNDTAIRMLVTQGLTMAVAFSLTPTSLTLTSAGAMSAIIDGAAGTARQLVYRTGGVERWLWTVDSVAEGGANAGSNLQLRSRNDDGSSLNANVISVVRSSGNVGIGIAPTSRLTVYESSTEVGSLAGVTIQQAGGGDSDLHWVRGSTIYSAGVDATDGKWKLSLGYQLGIGDFIVVDPSTGTVTITGLDGGSAASGLIGGDGIDLVGSTISVDASVIRDTRNLVAGSGLTGGGTLAADVTLNVGAGLGITVNANDIQIKLPATSGLVTDSTGLYIGAGDGIDVLTNSIAVDVTDFIDTAAGLTETSNNIQVHLHTASGMSFDGGTGGIKVGAGAGISVLASTIAINLATISGLTTSSGLAVGAGDGIDVLATTIAVDVTDFVDITKGLTEGSNNIQVNLHTTSGMSFDAGTGGIKVGAGAGISVLTSTIAISLASPNSGLSTASGLAVGAGDGINVVTNTVAVDVTDFIDTAAGLREDASNNIQVRLHTSSGMAFDGGTGGIKIVAANASISVNAADINVNLAHNWAWTGNHTFSTGVATFNTAPQVAANLNFSGSARSITSAAALTLNPTGDLILDPTGLIQLPDAQEMRTATFNDAVTGIEGFRLWQRGDTVRQLTIGAMRMDELYARVFTADEVRISRGEEFWSKSFGIVDTTFNLPALDANVSVWFENAPVLGNANLFDVGDWLMMRVVDWNTSLSIMLIWFQVNALLVAGSTDGYRQEWRLTRRSGGTTGATIKAGNLAVDMGVVGDGVVHLSAHKNAGGPMIQFGEATSVLGSTDSLGFDYYTRIGNLNGAAGISTDTYGIAAGNDLGLTPTSGFSGFTADGDDGLKMYNTDILLYDGAELSSSLTKDDGLAFSFSTLGKKEITWWADLDSIGALDQALSSITTRDDGTKTLVLTGGSGGGSGLAGAVELRALSSTNTLTHYMNTSEAYWLTASTRAATLKATGRLGVGLGMSSPASPLHAYEDTATTTAAAGVTIEQDGTGDAVLQWLLTGGQRWAIGIDNSASGDPLKIAANADVGTSPLLTLTTAGAMTLAGSLAVGTTALVPTSLTTPLWKALNSSGLEMQDDGGNTSLMALDGGNSVIVGASSYVEPFTGFNAQNNKALVVRQPTSTAAGSPFATILMSNNQTDATQGNIASFNFMNEASSNTDKRLAQFLVRTDSAIDNGEFLIRVFDAGVVNDALIVKSSGNVGIGTTTPGVDVIGTTDYAAGTRLLQVNGTTARILIRGSTNAALDLIDTGAGSNLKWMQLLKDGDVTRLRSLDDAGGVLLDNILTVQHDETRVGIGTATPGINVVGTTDFASGVNILQVDGGVAALIGRGTSSGSLHLISTSAPTDLKWMQIVTFSGLTRFTAVNDSGVTTYPNIITLDHDSGNVGFGTSSPGVNLVGTYDYPSTVRLAQVDGASARVMARGSTDAGLDLIDTGAGIDAKWMQLLNVSGYTTFRALNDSGGVAHSAVLTMNHVDGYVGINNAAPNAWLDINSEGSGFPTLQTSIYGSIAFSHLARRALGTPSSPTSVTSGTMLYGMGAYGYSSGGWLSNSSAQMLVLSTEAYNSGTSGKGGAEFAFYTRANGASDVARVMTISHNGRVGIGDTVMSDTVSTSPPSTLAVGTKLVVHNSAAEASVDNIWVVGYATLAPPSIMGRSAHGSAGAATATQNGDAILHIGGSGCVSSNLYSQNQVSMRFVATENWSSSARGTKISFVVTNNGSVAPAPALEILQNGLLVAPSVYSNSLAGSPRDLHIASDGTMGYAVSARRYKEDIQPLDDRYGDEFILGLKPISYRGKDDPTQTRQLGFVAEDVDALGAKELVVYGDDGTIESLSYNRFVAPLTSAVQRLIKDRDELRKGREQDKKRIDSLEKRLNALERRLAA